MGSYVLPLLAAMLLVTIGAEVIGKSETAEDYITNDYNTFSGNAEKKYRAVSCPSADIRDTARARSETIELHSRFESKYGKVFIHRCGSNQFNINGGCEFDKFTFAL